LLSFSTTTAPAASPKSIREFSQRLSLLIASDHITSIFSAFPACIALSAIVRAVSPLGHAFDISAVYPENVTPNISSISFATNADVDGKIYPPLNVQR
jgi:hypothetical protein